MKHRSGSTRLEAALRESEKIIRSLRASEAKFRGLAQQSLVGIIILEDGKISYTNPKFNEMFGYSAEEVLTQDVMALILESDRGTLGQKIRQGFAGEIDTAELAYRGVRKDGTVIDVELHGSVMEYGGKRALIGMLLDITERVRAERAVQDLQYRLRDQSTHDALTGLYNRRFLDEALSRELVLAGRHGHPVSVILGDLDSFKNVNDRHGHLAGDEVLRFFGSLMKRHARGSDICCRYGGEEFLVVLPRMPRLDAVERAEQLRSALSAAPVPFGTAQIPMTASFGVASFPRDGRTADQLIARADRMLYAAKQAGRNRVNVSTGSFPAFAAGRPDEKSIGGR